MYTRGWRVSWIDDAGQEFQMKRDIPTAIHAAISSLAVDGSLRFVLLETLLHRTVFTQIEASLKQEPALFRDQGYFDYI